MKWASELEQEDILLYMSVLTETINSDMPWRKLIHSSWLISKNLSYRNILYLLYRHESNIMSDFDHPNLLKFRETIKAKHKIYIITELVEGKDLM